MRIQKVIGITIICLAFAGLALAQGGPPQGQAPGGAPQGQESGAKVDMGPAFDSMDISKDGKVNKEEWEASGMPEGSYDTLFQMLDGDKDGVISKNELGAPLFDVDTNKDGKCSLEEYVTANKSAAANMGSEGRGGPPGGDRGGSAGGNPPGGQR